jgi:thiamine biosynthesis lipoprotein
VTLRIFWVCIGIFLSACSENVPEITKIKGYTMGTGYSVMWPSISNVQAEIVQQKIEAELVKINQQMSTYDSNSEISQFNQASAPFTQTISPEFADVLNLSLEIHSLSQGYFDISVGPLVNLWGFGPDKLTKLAPSEEQIQQAQSQIGLDVISLEGLRLSKLANRYLDLSAIAKGFAVDEVANLIEGLGIESYLVEIGGEIRVKGQKPEGLSWKVAVEAPDFSERRVQKILPLKDVAMATSGDYRNYFEDKGQRFSHSIDPFTAKPVKHKLASVTIIDEHCARADALATAMLVMGEQKAKEFAVQKGIKAYLIVREEHSFTEYLSPTFENWLNP